MLQQKLQAGTNKCRHELQCKHSFSCATVPLRYNVSRNDTKYKSSLLPDNLHQHPLAALSVKLAVEDLLPRPKMKPAAGYRRHHFAPHYLPFQVGVGVYFAGVVAVGRDRLMGRKFFQPDIKVVVQASALTAS
jgi:hypothetical protein